MELGIIKEAWRKIEAEEMCKASCACKNYWIGYLKIVILLMAQEAMLQAMPQCCAYAGLLAPGVIYKTKYRPGCEHQLGRKNFQFINLKR